MRHVEERSEALKCTWWEELEKDNGTDGIVAPIYVTSASLKVENTSENSVDVTL